MERFYKFIIERTQYKILLERSFFPFLELEKLTYLKLFLICSNTPLLEFWGRRMEMNIDDVLNDSKEYGQVDDNMNDALKAILAGRKG